MEMWILLGEGALFPRMVLCIPQISWEIRLFDHNMILPFVFLGNLEIWRNLLNSFQNLLYKETHSSVITNGSQNFSRGNNISFATILPFLHIYINCKIHLTSIPLSIKLDCKSITKRTKTNSKIPWVFMVSKQWGMINVVNLTYHLLPLFLSIFFLLFFLWILSPNSSAAPMDRASSSSWKSCITPVPEPWTSTTSWPLEEGWFLNY